MNNFEKVETVEKIIKDAKREILKEDPNTDFGYYLAFFSDYGIKKEDKNDIYKMLYTRIFSGDGIQEIMQADNYFDIGIWV